jgi:hypothetical protein
VQSAQVVQGARVNPDTLVVVHCYQGDAHQVEAFLPQYLHHGCPVLVLSPADSPVLINHPGVECRSAGERAYFGQKSLDRQRAHLELLMEYPQKYRLLNDADSMCLSPRLPAYLYEEAEGTVWSNEVKEGRPHESPYPKYAQHPPYFLTRESMARMNAVPHVEAHPITPFVDHLMIVLTAEAELAHRSYPDGASFPAWRHGPIPETKLLGHNPVHRNERRGFDGTARMVKMVARGVVMIHSVKHPEVRDRLVSAHAQHVNIQRRKAERRARLLARASA